MPSVEHNKEGQAGVVIPSGDERVEYGILVLAPGSEWKGPLDFPDDRALVLGHIKTWRRNFRASEPRWHQIIIIISLSPRQLSPRVSQLSDIYRLQPVIFYDVGRWD